MANNDGVGEFGFVQGVIIGQTRPWRRIDCNTKSSCRSGLRQCWFGFPPKESTGIGSSGQYRKLKTPAPSGSGPYQWKEAARGSEQQWSSCFCLNDCRRSSQGGLLKSRRVRRRGEWMHLEESQEREGGLSLFGAARDGVAAVEFSSLCLKAENKEGNHV